MKKIFISIIRYYQCHISPLLGKNKCKYYPTCSQYMIEAVELHGIKGFFMGIWRILRCNPFSKGGYDPVPEKKHKN